MDTVRRWWRAWAEKDLETVERMIDPDYLEHTPGALLQPIGLRQLREESTRYCNDVHISEWEIFDPVTKALTGSVICSYRFAFSGRHRGREFSFTGWATDVLSFRRGAWVFVSHRGTLGLEPPLSLRRTGHRTASRGESAN